MPAQSNASSTRVDEIIDGIFRISTPVPASVVPGGFTFNQFLAAAPQAVPRCGQIAAMVSIGDLADRPPRALADQEHLSLGRHTVQWLDAPHLPHGWECGFLNQTTTHTLFCGDLFTRFGEVHPALTEDDFLEPSEAARAGMDCYAHSPDTGRLLERLAATSPTTLACTHGPAWRGDGAALLRRLASRLARSAPRRHVLVKGRRAEPPFP